MKTTSFETSKKLKELGVDLSSNFYWLIDKENIGTNYGVDGLSLEYIKSIVAKEAYDKAKNTYKAYTLEDILSCFQDGRVDMRLRDGYKNFRYNCTEGISVVEDNETLADTAARLLIKLIEDGIINVDEVK